MAVLAVRVGELGAAEARRGTTVSTPSTSATASATAAGNPPGGPKAPRFGLHHEVASKPRSTSASTDSVADAANTVMNATSATPMRRADAVADVRFGLRAAFSVARRPVTPSQARQRRAERRDAGSGEHRSDDDGADDDEEGAEPDRRDGVGVAIPGPGGRQGERAEDEHDDAAEHDAGLDAPERSMATSRRAASGGTRVARIAGMTAAISVTTRPMTKRDHDGRRADDERRRSGRSAPEGLEEGGDALGQQRCPAARPSTAATSPTSDGLEHHRPEHLGSAGADRPQERELAVRWARGSRRCWR